MFSNSNYYKRTSELTKITFFIRIDGDSNFAYQNVNNYKLCVRRKMSTNKKYKLKPPRENSHKCVNNYLSFSPSSSSISSSPSVESSSDQYFHKICCGKYIDPSKGYQSSCNCTIMLRNCLTCIHTQSVVARELCHFLLQSQESLHLKVSNHTLVGLHG